MFFKSSTNQTEFLGFYLHSTITPIILCLSLALVLSTQIWSDPIACKTSNRYHVDEQLLNAHCFSRATYRSIPYDSDHQNPSNDDGFTRLSQVFYPYYQWIWVILLIQAIGFYFPNFVWKRLERNRLSNLMVKVDENEPEKVAKILNLSFGSNREYFLGHLFCVFLILLNLLTQTLVLNRIFHYRWITYGYDVVAQLFSTGDDPTTEILQEIPSGIDQESDSDDPMSLIFPVLTKCDYRRIGPTGSLEIYEVNCALPLNTFNQKFYLILWFWMWILVELILVQIVILLGSYYILPLRMRFLKRRIQLESDEIQMGLKRLINELGIGDWFWLRTVERNMDSLDFYQILVEIVKLRMRAQNGAKLLNNIEDVL